MPKITNIEYSGIKHQVDVPVGSTFIKGARDNAILGIEADYGRACARSTCHIYVTQSGLGSSPKPMTWKRYA
jgi:2Fe-2S ferredoxin